MHFSRRISKGTVYWGLKGNFFYGRLHMCDLLYLFHYSCVQRSHHIRAHPNGTLNVHSTNGPPCSFLLYKLIDSILQKNAYLMPSTLMCWIVVHFTVPPSKKPHNHFIILKMNGKNEIKLKTAKIQGFYFIF